LRPDLRGEPEEIYEAFGVLVREEGAGRKAREGGVVQGIGRLHARARHRSLPELQADAARHLLLRRVDEGAEGLAKGAEPFALVEGLGEALGDGHLEGEGLPVEAELFELGVGLHDDRTAGRLVDSPGFHSHNPVLHHVEDAHPVLTAEGVELPDELDSVHLAAVDRDGQALVEADRHVLGLVGRLRRRDADLEHALELRLVGGILEVETLVAYMPEVVVAAVGIGFFHGDRDVPLLEVGDLVLAARQVPDPPGRDHLHLGGEGLDPELEAHLVVALARASVRDRGGALRDGHLGQALGEQGPGRRGSKQIATLVDGPGFHERPKVVEDEFFLQVLHHKLRGTGCDGLLLEGGPVAFLADVAADRDDLAVVILFQPGHDHRGVESAGIGEYYFLLHVCSFSRPRRRAGVNHSF
jgi:hypothetical protein